jgi:hypothetical protein
MWLIAGQRISRWFHKLAGLAVIALPRLAGAPSVTGKSICAASIDDQIHSGIPVRRGHFLYYSRIFRRLLP